MGDSGLDHPLQSPEVNLSLLQSLIEQEDLDQIEVGMTRNQVRFLLGTPMIDDPFHKDRWDYVYFLKIGREDATFKRWVSVVFEENLVSEIRKDQELAPEL